MRWDGHVTHVGETEIYIKFQLDSLNRRDNFRILGVDGRKI
jgi:hypothetical protein